MKILTLNARNWGRDKDKSSPYYWKTRMKAMKRMLQDIDPDIICFQEMVFPATLYIPRCYRKVRPSFFHPIYIKKGLKTRDHSFKRYLEKVEVFAYQDWWLVINVHSSWEQSVHNKVMEQVQIWMNKARAWYSNCIACGDFNNPPVPSEELMLIETTPPGRETFCNFDTGKGARIDYFLSAQIQGDERAFVITNGYGAERISDHYPVLLMIDT